MIKSDAFHMHLTALAKEQHSFKPLYIFSGDEPLLMMEAIDALRALARTGGFTEREVLVQDRYFDWAALINAGQTMSLFGDKRFVELRMPTGKPGRDGAESLKHFAEQINNTGNGVDTIICIILPRLDSKTKSSAWFSALDEAGMAIQIDSIDRLALPHWIGQRLKKQSQEVEAGESGQRALQFMSDQVEGNLIAAHQEIQKLALLYPAGQLSEEQIRSAVLKVARYDIFELTESMLSGDAARLNRMLEGLQGEGEPLPLILWSVSDELRTLHKVQSALLAGDALANLLRNYRIWGKREKLYPVALKRIAPKKLKQAIVLAANLDKQVKGLLVRDLPSNPWDGLRLIGGLLR
ncbi:DNA polymerase III subunit delta [Polynucleobacter sp. UK-FUSCHL-C3]|uniref:DNA polymerase III subunit delta n=1 Tax=Polynucleobacter sp. UK-FUSCHL-C3 TaxID=2955208 RepID=A0AAU8A2M4_9BURK